jgi:hypothetical protein
VRVELSVEVHRRRLSGAASIHHKRDGPEPPHEPDEDAAPRGRHRARVLDFERQRPPRVCVPRKIVGVVVLGVVHTLLPPPQS